MTILICAIRDNIARAEADDTARSKTRDLYTARYLRNSNLASGHQQRLVLHQSDRTALEQVVSGGGMDGETLIEQAYHYFSSQLSPLTSDQTLTLLTHIAKRLTAVWVVLEPGDNPHRVFQTLNSGGKQLDQADLVRNYFFLLLGDAGNSFYSDHWRNLESDVPAGKLQSFLAAWAVSQGFDGVVGKLFRYFQSDLRSSEYNTDDVIKYGSSLVGAAKLYRHMLFPSEMSGVSAATRRTMQTLARWEIKPAEGLVLHLMRSFVSGSLSESALGSACEVILSYMARRFLVGFAPNRHRSIFVHIAHRLRGRPDLQGDELVQFLRALLSDLTGDNAWPTDNVLAERVQATPVYSGPRRIWGFLVLERVNRSYHEYPANAPDLDDATYTVEHILPQRPSKLWESDLEEWGVPSTSSLMETHLHVLGNLTLSATNRQLSNRRFSDKQAIYKDDTLKLNRAILPLDRWDAETINVRGQELIGRAMKEFIRPLSRDEISGLGYFDASVDALPDEETLDGEQLGDEVTGRQ